MRRNFTSFMQEIICDGNFLNRADYDSEKVFSATIYLPSACLDVLSAMLLLLRLVELCSVVLLVSSSPSSS